MMTTSNFTGLRSFQASAADIPMGTPVCLLNTGRIEDAKNHVAFPVIGVADMAIPADGFGNIAMFSRTFMVRVGGAVTVGEYVPVPGALAHWFLIALESATADGDIIECVPDVVCAS